MEKNFLKKYYVSYILAIILNILFMTICIIGYNNIVNPTMPLYADLLFYIITAIFFIATSLTSFICIVRKLKKHINEMKKVVDLIESGDTDARIVFDSSIELDDLSASINRLGERVKLIESTNKSFMANISHDLKTPLTSIIGFIDGILDGTIPPESYFDSLEIVRHETERLSKLVRVMLNLSRMEAGEIKPNYQSFDLMSVISDVVCSFDDRLTNKVLDIRGIEHECILINADEELLHQAIYNLFDNAVKFVNFGGYIQFSFTQVGKYLQIIIRNSGSFVNESEKDRLFDKFYKSDESRGIDKNGVGLGLYIVSLIMSLHKGMVIVNSIKEQYTEFVVSLPYNKK